MRFVSKKIFAFTAVGTALFVLLWITAHFAKPGSFGQLLETACHSIGGKWGAHDRCVTRACYASHNCGYWIHPETWRDRVKLGDDIATVVFWFGEPTRIDGNTYYWAIGKGGGPYRTFSATFQDGRLTALSPIFMSQ